jgi:hypothetical protein
MIIMSRLAVRFVSLRAWTCVTDLPPPGPESRTAMRSKANTNFEIDRNAVPRFKCLPDLPIFLNTAGSEALMISIKLDYRRRNPAGRLQIPDKINGMCR